MEEGFPKTTQSHMIRIAITGPESSGKSDLAEALSKYYGTSYAPEYARAYLKKHGPEYTMEDLDEICRGQIEEEEKALARANRICFFDTDMLVLKIWSQFRFGRVSDFIEKAKTERHYDLHLLCKPDLPWTPDPLRESPEPKEREILFDLYKNELDSDGCTYSIVEGQGDARLKSAISALKHFLYSPNI
jgi:NadR type nicotinamide-nucleotide adenylyltransferase